jgi:cytosine/adenosine deaminase-related metal-dependent hydrolase
VLDTLITGGHLLTMAGGGDGFVEDGAVGMRGRLIVAVGRREDVGAQGPATMTLDARDRLVMAGLIDAHIHSAAVLGRGWAQEVYAETGQNVTLSMVAGRVIYRDGRFANVDADQVYRDVREAADRLQRATAADERTRDLPIVDLTRRGLA